MKHLLPRLSYANVVSTLCLFLLLGGGALAATRLGRNSVGPKQLQKAAVTTAKIRNRAVTGAKIKLSTLGAVPSANHAASADFATRAASAETAARATSAASAGAISPPEAVHFVGAAGEPAFENGFVNASPGTSPVGFYRDRECVVHLLGSMQGPSQQIAFQLPAADAPAQPAFGSIAVAGPEAGNLTVTSSGLVDPASEAGGTPVFGLDGFSFRVAGC